MEEIVSTLPEVIVVRDGGVWNRMGEPRDGHAIARALRGGEEHFVHSIVFWRRADVETFLAMGAPTRTDFWWVVGDHFCTRDGEGGSIEVKISEKASVG